MNFTINKTRLRPSITVGPKCVSEEREGWRTIKTTHEDIIDGKVSLLIYHHLAYMNRINQRIEEGDVSNPFYDNDKHRLGNTFFQCAFVCIHLDRDVSKALYWTRKAYACFDYNGSFCMDDRQFTDYSYQPDDSIWLHTDIFKGFDWDIVAMVKTITFLGANESNYKIGTIKEDPDLTHVFIREQQFNKYIMMEHDKRKAYAK
jgi:hypothetical protein